MNDDASPLLVFFTDARSGPARRMESLLAHLARKERGRLRVAQIDIDEQPDARRAVRRSRRCRRSSWSRTSASSDASRAASARRGSSGCSSRTCEPRWPRA